MEVKSSLSLLLISVSLKAAINPAEPMKILRGTLLPTSFGEKNNGIGQTPMRARPHGSYILIADSRQIQEDSVLQNVTFVIGNSNAGSQF